MLINVVGDATRIDYLKYPGPNAIIHICNNMGGWGAGFVLNLSRQYPEAEKAYRALAEYELGSVGFVTCRQHNNTLTVCNIIAQDGYRSNRNPCPLNYEALADALQAIAKVLPTTTTLHMPHIGCGLAGGNLSRVIELLHTYLPLHTKVMYTFKPEINN